MPVEIARSAPRPSFGLPELLVAIHTSRQSCCKAGKARIFTPVRESSGESRMSCLEPKEVVEESGFSSYIHGLQRQRDAYSDHIGFSRARLSIVSPSEPVVVDADCLKLGLHRRHDQPDILDN